MTLTIRSNDGIRGYRDGLRMAARVVGAELNRGGSLARAIDLLILMSDGVDATLTALEVPEPNPPEIPGGSGKAVDDGGAGGGEVR
jgi:hypothetical protein